ncbi:hypothetical protein ANRL4_03604 [Anaerolineae bacterium]|nr:hypothetical protein ANRL4_03604 [Anaerolineae bacterium]
MPQEYLDFDLSIDPDPDDDDLFIVTASTLGVSRSDYFEFHLEGLELENHLVKLENLLKKGTRTLKSAPAPQVSEKERPVRELGKKMFEALLPSELLTLYRQAHNHSYQQEMSGVRLRLRINTPQWNTLPWELMYDPDLECYLGVKRNTPIIRFPEIRIPPPPLKVKGKLRILAMIANPDDLELDKLNVEREQERLTRALKPIEAGIEIGWIKGTVEALDDALNSDKRWHVFHFIGHGGFEDHQGGALALEDQRGKMREYRAEHLKNRLTGHPSMRFAFLNCCNGATSSKSDVFSSTAATLVRGGLAGVLAMQFEISDTGAIRIAERFYQGLVAGQRLESVVTAAREHVSELESFEWATPVLYLASPNGVLFEVEEPSPPRPASGVYPLPQDEGRNTPVSSGAGTADTPSFDPKSIYNLAGDLDEAGRYEESIPLYVYLLALKPPYRESSVRALLAQAREQAQIKAEKATSKTLVAFVRKPPLTPYINQDVINAFVLAAEAAGEKHSYWNWIVSANLAYLATDRRRPYTGPDVDQLPGLSPEQKSLVKLALAGEDLSILKPEDEGVIRKYTNQDVINAFWEAARAAGERDGFWQWIVRAGLSNIANDREGLFAGPAISSLPNLTLEQRRSILNAIKGMTPVPIEAEKLLPLDWITHIDDWGSGNNDCGQVCVLMLLRYYGMGGDQSVKKLHAKLAGKTSASQLVWLAGQFGLTLKVDTTFADVDGLRIPLERGRPVILLVDYRELQYPVHLPSNVEWHWVVVSGYYGEGYIVDDPLWLAIGQGDKGGNNLKIKRDMLQKAMAQIEGKYNAIY